MAGRSFLSKDTLVPVGAIFAAVGLTITALRSIDGPSRLHDTELAKINVELITLRERIVKVELRSDKADERWAAVQADLAAIKQAVLNKQSLAVKP